MGFIHSGWKDAAGHALLVKQREFAAEGLWEAAVRAHGGPFDCNSTAWRYAACLPVCRTACDTRTSPEPPGWDSRGYSYGLRREYFNVLGEAFESPTRTPFSRAWVELVYALCRTDALPGGVRASYRGVAKRAFQTFLGIASRGALGNRARFARELRVAASGGHTLPAGIAPAILGALIGHAVSTTPALGGREDVCLHEEDRALLRETWNSEEEEHYTAALCTSMASYVAGARYHTDRSTGQYAPPHETALSPSVWVYDVEEGVPTRAWRFEILRVLTELARGLGAEHSGGPIPEARGLVAYFAAAAALCDKRCTVTWPMVVASKHPEKTGGIVVATSARPNPVIFGEDRLPVTAGIAYGIHETTGEARVLGMADAHVGVGGHALGEKSAPGMLAAMLAEHVCVELPPDGKGTPVEFQWATPFVMQVPDPRAYVRAKIEGAFFRTGAAAPQEESA